MKPTPELEELWTQHPDGKAIKELYFSKGETFQKYLNIIAIASVEELESIIITLDYVIAERAMEVMKQ